MGRAPYYILFAGVNGAGKSTLYRTGLWQSGGIKGAEALPRVNSDEIAAENGWDSRSQSSQLKAGRIAVELIDAHFSKRESFNQETTLTGHAIMRNIRTARELGYRIVMFYVGVDTPEIANERIAKRDSLGGHFIPSDTVAHRYDASLVNLVDAVQVCQEVYLYDNTRKFELEAWFALGELMYMTPSGLDHSWVTRTTEALGYVEVKL